MENGKLIEIDGSFGSGGGQILRTATALSAITGKPYRIFNIRKGRPKPGLAPQHLLGLRALSQLCSGKLEGDRLGSKEIKFYPGPIDKGETSLNLKIETAGSITLILQTLILPALFSQKPVEITLDGGATDTFFSPTIDHFRYVFLRILEKLGAKVEINILRRGYYPEGGAEVMVKVFPSDPQRDQQRDPSSSTRTGLVAGLVAKLKPLNLIKRGELKKILVLSGASKLLENKKVAERQAAGAREILGKLKLPLEERIEYYKTQSPGSQICLVASFENTVIGTDNLGKLGKRAEDVGREAVLELLKESQTNGCLDKHLSDQILPYVALTGSKSQITVSEITNHCKTNIWVIEKFTQHQNEISGAGFLPGKFETKNNLISWNPS